MSTYLGDAGIGVSDLDRSGALTFALVNEHVL